MDRAGPEYEPKKLIKEVDMRKLSTGDDATLGNYRKLSVAFFGEKSEAVKFLDDKIAESPNGADEEVIVEESQMIYLLGTMAFDLTDQGE